MKKILIRIGNREREFDFHEQKDAARFMIVAAFEEIMSENRAGVMAAYEEVAKQSGVSVDTVRRKVK